MPSRLLASTLLVVLPVLLAGSARAERGTLVQLDGTDGCISKDGTGGECAIGAGLAGALDLAVTPDGSGVYVASFSNDAVAVLRRNERKADGPIGKLTQPSGAGACVSEAAGGPCTDGTGLTDPFAVSGRTRPPSGSSRSAESNEGATADGRVFLAPSGSRCAASRLRGHHVVTRSARAP